MNGLEPDRDPAFLGATVGERIRQLRHRRGWTQMQLSAEANVNQGYLSAIERGQRAPRAGTLKAIAVALDVPEAILLGEGEGHDAPRTLDMRELPLFGSIPNGPPAESQEQLEMFPVLRHLWHTDRYCLRCEFDSMEPTLKRGDLILVEYRPGASPEFVQGKICACLVDGRPTLKRVSVEYRESEILVILRGDNPASPPIVVDQSRDFSIQGVAVCLVSREL
ncbi:MAG: LexA family transcriptional regulator [Phycisphaerales bacterium]|nr:LexA family transcriptional regulator [Phycisphaerales bacterium]MCB9862266.1 LexA family transcriptional regulator [Phycisphaerales bacterium]